MWARTVRTRCADRAEKKQDLQAGSHPVCAFLTCGRATIGWARPCVSRSPFGYERAVPPRNAVQLAFDRFGRSAGMELHRRAWYRTSDEVVAVSELQKSQYGRSYYFNQGFWLRELGDERYPRQSSCHITLRLETLASEERHRVARLLDLDHGIPDEERIEKLVALLNERISPVIERGSSIAGLRAMIDDRTLSHAAILGVAQPLLAIDRGPGGTAP